MCDRTLGLNGSIGIKARYNQASDEARLEIHTAAAPGTRLAARTGWLFMVCAALMCLAMWFTAVFVATDALSNSKNLRPPQEPIGGIRVRCDT